MDKFKWDQLRISVALMQLIPLELLHSTLDSIRKARESFLLDLAGTLEPHRMNRPAEFLKLRNPYLFIYLFQFNGIKGNTN